MEERFGISIQISLASLNLNKDTNRNSDKRNDHILAIWRQAKSISDPRYLLLFAVTSTAQERALTISGNFLVFVSG